MIVEKPCRQIQTEERGMTNLIRSEKIEKILNKQSTAKTFPSWLNSCIKLSLANSDKETELLLKGILSKYNSFKNKDLIEIEIVGWKGKDTIEIYKGFENDFIIKSHRKNKETGEIEETTHEVNKEDVNRLLFWIKKWVIGESHKCYDFAEIIGESDWKEIWKKRTDVYFVKYYYPLKCLEAMGLIKYGGRGQVTKIK